MKLTDVEEKVLEGSCPNRPHTVFWKPEEHEAMARFVKLGLLYTKKVKGKYRGLYHYTSKAGRALLKQLKGSK